jgi:hypothetical protein
LAFGWSVTDRVSHLFCTIAVGRTSGNIHFGFYYGSALRDPEKRLLGQGNLYRYILVNDVKEFPTAYMKKLLKESYSNAITKVKDKRQLMEGRTITKSISAAKRTSGKKKKAASKAKPLRKSRSSKR